MSAELLPARRRAALETVRSVLAALVVVALLGSFAAVLSYRADVEEAHRERGVVLQGYSGLRGGTLDHPTIVGIAERLGRTPAQVVVRWHLDHGTVVIPKSEHPDRIRANADVGGFTLSDDDVAALDALGAGA